MECVCILILKSFIFFKHKNENKKSKNKKTSEKSEVCVPLTGDISKHLVEDLERIVEIKNSVM